MQPFTTNCGMPESEMNMNHTPDEMMMHGMKCLVDNFGLVNAEQFISSMRASCPDYTLWRRRMFDGIILDEVKEWP